MLLNIDTYLKLGYTTIFTVKGGFNMEWELLGYKEHPFSVNPISMDTLELYTGHETEIKICQNTLLDRNVRLVIEGERGVGTTSFANYIKFASQKKRHYLAPRDEVSVERNWNLESLLTAVISTIVREIEIAHGAAVKKNKVFLEAKALCYRLSEFYNNFGLTAFSVGGNYGKSSSITQPSFIPSTTLGHHLQDLGQLAVKLGYKNGILIQLNNLDVNVVYTEEHLKYLCNAARDFFQISYVSWLLVGDIGLRSLIARKVDHLDDIVSDEITIKPVVKSVYHELIRRRLSYYELKRNTLFPIGRDVFDYLYEITHGRLRYIFGLVYALMNRLHVGKLVQNLSLELAKETITALAKERMQKFSLSPSEIDIIKKLVKVEKSNVADLANSIRKNRTYLSRSLNKLLNDKIVIVKQEGKQRVYMPSLDAKIAFQ